MFMAAWVSFSEFSEYSSPLWLEVIYRRMDVGKIRTILCADHSIRSKVSFTNQGRYGHLQSGLWQIYTEIHHLKTARNLKVNDDTA